MSTGGSCCRQQGLSRLDILGGTWRGSVLDGVRSRYRTCRCLVSVLCVCFHDCEVPAGIPWRRTSRSNLDTIVHMS